MRVTARPPPSFRTIATPWITPPASCAPRFGKAGCAAARARARAAGAVPPAPDGALAFTRPSLLCTVNTLGHDVELPTPGTPLLSSAPVSVDGAAAHLPGDSCTWWAI